MLPLRRAQELSNSYFGSRASVQIRPTSESGDAWPMHRANAHQHSANVGQHRSTSRCRPMLAGLRPHSAKPRPWINIGQPRPNFGPTRPVLVELGQIRIKHDHSLAGIGHIVAGSERTLSSRSNASTALGPQQHSRHQCPPSRTGYRNGPTWRRCARLAPGGHMGCAAGDGLGRGHPWAEQGEVVGAPRGAASSGARLVRSASASSIDAPGSGGSRRASAATLCEGVAARATAGALGRAVEALSLGRAARRLALQPQSWPRPWCRRMSGVSCLWRWLRCLSSPQQHNQRRARTSRNSERGSLGAA